MSEQPTRLVPHPRTPTPEQAERRRIVDERNRQMQEKGVPFPHKTGGIFGGKPTERKK